IESQRPSPELAAKIDKLLAESAPLEDSRPEIIRQLAPHAAASVTVLQQRARELEKQALELKRLARQVHQQQVLDELAKATQGKEDEISLFRAGLLIARLDNEELDVQGYVHQLDRLAKELKATVPEDADEAARLAALNKFLFEENGFHGSRADYYNSSNSYLNEVLDDR